MYEVGQEVDLIVDARKWAMRAFGSDNAGGDLLPVAGTVTEASDVALTIQPPSTERFVPFAIGVRYDEILGTAADFGLD